MLVKTRMSKHRKGQEQGFSMVEAVVAIAMLGMGILSLVSLIPFAIKDDYRTRIDTTATFVAMREMEQILANPSALPASSMPRMMPASPQRQRLIYPPAAQIWPPETLIGHRHIRRSRRDSNALSLLGGAPSATTSRSMRTAMTFGGISL